MKGLVLDIPLKKPQVRLALVETMKNALVDIKDIPEEVVKKAYNDIDSSSTYDTPKLFDTSILLIDLTLHHLELIDWGQTVARLDTFPNDTILI